MPSDKPYYTIDAQEARKKREARSLRRKEKRQQMVQRLAMLRGSGSMLFWLSALAFSLSCYYFLWKLIF